MTKQTFLSQVQRIAQSQPVYREGGVGADGTCDCIGLVMGAMYACGHPAYDLHSSNYFARFQTDELQLLTDENQLEAGMVVYKARNGENTLNARYLPGGRCYTGDLMDYYHVGVVESVQPLIIVHCTSTSGADGIVRDSALHGWTHCGRVAGLAEDAPEGETATVAARNGRTVNLRKRPDKQAPVLKRVPVGSQVMIGTSAQGWARVTHEGTTGYMMESFLVRGDEAQPWVKLPLPAVLQMIETLRAYTLADAKEEML